MRRVCVLTKELKSDTSFMYSNPFYNITRALDLYKSYLAAMNKIFIYPRPCVYKMTSAFFLTGCRVSVLLSCSAVFLLFKISTKPAKNCPIFLSALTFSVLIQRAAKKKSRKKLASCAFRKFHLAFIFFIFPVNFELFIHSYRLTWLTGSSVLAQTKE